MSTSPDVPSRFEQHAIIQFLTIEKFSAAGIYKRFKITYGNGVMSIQHVVVVTKKPPMCRILRYHFIAWMDQ